METSIIGYPRIGKDRELKFAIEAYWKGESSKEELLNTGREIRRKQWSNQKKSGLTYIPSNTFSFYDGMLDASILLNAVPAKYRELELGDLDTYFAMARGYQGEAGDVKAQAMKKWFNTNYHYLVPELEDDMEIELHADKLFQEYEEACSLGIQTRPVTIGPLTFLKLAKVTGQKSKREFETAVTTAFSNLLEKCEEKKIEWIQFDEPILVMDQTDDDKILLYKIYKEILKHKHSVKVLIQTYFGDVRDCYNTILSLDFDGVGLDFVEGKYTMELIEKNGFPKDKYLFAGLINGKNIWKCDYAACLEKIERLKEKINHVVLGTSCSLLHVPYTVESEKKLSDEVLRCFSFAKEKLEELSELSILLEDADYKTNTFFLSNQEILHSRKEMRNEAVCELVSQLKESDFVREGKREERQKLQREELGLGLLPTTTIGSFPQTKEVKQNRSSYKRGEITKEQYDLKIFELMEECIRLQEKIGLDVLVHGEFERNDMVEFFGEHLSGYVFTEKAWVQSYGTRCVKPPIIFGDITREEQMTVLYSKYAQSLTDKPVKGMLTGPVTILNWSFPREDITLKDMAYQIGLAIREEVLDLEAAGIKVIQIDEAALREKLPLREADWYQEYLDWAIPAFRLCHSGVQKDTQIHTHMCYSEFEDILDAIDDMDADVITFEASRSNLSILKALHKCGFETESGPGVYDIHSPRVPSVEEIVSALKEMLKWIPKEKLWVNPDCGLKTRGTTETVKSLENLVAAAKLVR